ncbi:MAG TPA: hypothetical protein DCL75_03040 [Ktedonobacter sp.]|nr:hypothetical protein [Ktedonobacter sp.]HAT44919.1 hypothetical protein [Ktedonobacter sp.]HCF84870.1 hypothetical protein [Ktedonobacter sp.]HCJ34589.1 hypothetical protein [Ktedonobacter sp.]
MGTMKEIADSVRGSLIPQFCILRRVPLRYHHVLPLKVMKQHQCIVIGAAQGVLTVAITDRQNTAVIESLRRLTGHAIFPVLVGQASMRLLIRRIERCQQSKRAFCRRPSNYEKYNISRTLLYITSKWNQ